MLNNSLSVNTYAYGRKGMSRGQLTFILARGIGQSFIAKGVEAADVREFLHEELAREAA